MNLTTSKTAKIFAGVVGFAIAFAFVAGFSVSKAAAAPTPPLTVGSSGAQVSALQSFLISKGFSIPAGATGYFGGQTKAALAAFQSANGISPAAGYYGSITAAKVASMEGSMGGSTGSTPGCPAGAMFNSMTGAPCTSSTSTPGCPAGAMYNSMTGAPCTSTTPSTGASEGSFTVAQGAQPANNTNVTTTTNTPVYGIKVKATDSNMVIDRADLEFAVTVNGTTVNPANFITGISAWDGSTLLMSKSLSASDFTKDSSNLYYIRLTGLGFNVAKDAEKTIVFAVNTAGISSADYARSMTVKGWSGTTQNVRGVDSIGLNTYGNANWTSTFTFNASNNATLTGSINLASTPKAQTIAVNTTDGVRGVTMQTVDLKSTVGDSNLTDMRVYVKTDSGANSAPTALYLYDGSTLLSSASVTVTTGSGTVNFSNLDVAIAKDQTKTLTVKADFPSTAAGVASTTIATSGSETNTTVFETADGSTKEVTISSAITGNDVHLYADSAAMWSLVSATAVGTTGEIGVASSSITGSIVLNVKANGGTLTKPTASNFTVFFASSTALTSNGGTGYSSANGISVTPTVVVSPNDSTVGDGGTYQVTITGTIYSNNTSLGSSQPLFMAVNNVDWSITKVGGSNAVTDQNWGIDTFYTNSVQLTKGLQ